MECPVCHSHGYPGYPRIRSCKCDAPSHIDCLVGRYQCTVCREAYLIQVPNHVADGMALSSARWRGNIRRVPCAVGCVVVGMVAWYIVSLLVVWVVLLDERVTTGTESFWVPDWILFTGMVFFSGNGVIASEHPPLCLSRNMETVCRRVRRWGARMDAVVFVGVVIPYCVGAVERMHSVWNGAHPTFWLVLVLAFMIGVLFQGLSWPSLSIWSLCYSWLACRQDHDLAHAFVWHVSYMDVDHPHVRSGFSTLQTQVFDPAVLALNSH